MNNKRSIKAEGAHKILLGVIVVSLCLIVYSLWQSVASSNISPLSQSHPKISQDYRYLIDDSSKYVSADLLHQLDSFVHSKPEEIPYDLSGKTYWVLLNLTNAEQSDLSIVLHVDNAMLAEQAYYLLSNDNQTLKPIETEQSVLSRTFPQVVFKLSRESQVSVLLKLRAGGPSNIPLIAYEQSQFSKKVLFTLAFYGTFVGIMLVMALYNLVLFTAIKDKVYLFYVGYLLSTFVVIGSVTGFGYLIFPDNIQHILNRYSLFFHYTLVLFLLLFSLFFLRYDKTRGRLYWLGICFAGLLIALSLISQILSHEYQAKLFFSLQPFLIAITLAIVLLRLKRSYGWARFYFLSWIPLLLGATIQPLVLLNQLDYSFLTRNAFMFAVLIEIIFMALALAERMKRFEIERLREISYHPGTHMPRKVLIEKAIAELVVTKNKRFSVLVIEPEQIERVVLYVTDFKNTELFKRIYDRLTPLFAYNDAIVTLGDNGEKISFLNGNRLAIIVDHQYSQQSLNVLISSVQQLVQEAYQLDDLKIPLSALIGVSTYPEHGDSGIKLLSRAQLALTNAEFTHHKWSEFEPESEDLSAYNLALASDLKQAVEQNKLKLYHQPQIDLKTMNVCGSEVLLRWEHPEQGFIPPDVFIPIAEDMGIINRLTHWVLNQAISQQQELIEHGYNHMISINISGKDVLADDFYNFVVELIERSELPASKIALELTESATISNSSVAVSVIGKLSELGITISIDDFGTGYSSMAYISELPFRELKIDRQFVENVCDDNKRKIIAETTVKMAKGLGLEVVAEGVNSPLDENTLRDFGSDIGQGFYYAKPMPIEDYIQWLGQEVNGRVAHFKSVQVENSAVEGEFIPKVI
ncbi:EAL domain-containing protein [Thalassotalea atypica]|uniref:EAL domain-containing protein n=1 Tax=Thalassotalea atypica TaxID=2054316 RepID=UPI002573C5DB|nr:EAL domain-containing protein [Thalassotalea atypica]